ncbi:MAG TPA: class I SAM-dependent methyltransferase [Cyclobacteriaceae bacterium]
MTDPWLQRWNDRYSDEAYAFGLEPNDYLKEQLEKLNPGKILFAGEGEGRNAVFAAKMGWSVSAFDISIEGRRKARLLAEANNVALDYQVGELPDLSFQSEQFDAIALIYAHFPAELITPYHKMLDSYLRKGGTVIFEAFGKNHIAHRVKNPNVGGPTKLQELFSMEELRSDFLNYEVIELEEKVIELNEGIYHKGKGSVIRFVGRKK